MKRLIMDVNGWIGIHKYKDYYKRINNTCYIISNRIYIGTYASATSIPLKIIKI